VKPNEGGACFKKTSNWKKYGFDTLVNSCEHVGNLGLGDIIRKIEYSKLLQ
jgi:hypothetical protein